VIFFTKHIKKGFTLIELLVVISIISLLSSIVFTTLGSTREKAVTASIIKALSPLKVAVGLCCSQDGGLLNTGNSGGGSVCTPPFSPDILYYTAGQLRVNSVNWSISGQCGVATNPTIRLYITGHPKAVCNDPNYWRVRENQIMLPAGC